MSYVNTFTKPWRPILPDGSDATALRRRPLLDALTSLRIPGIEAEMGKDRLLAAYSDHLESVAATMRAPDRSGTISEYEMRRAAEHIGGANAAV